jgi:hypothetical protein
MHSLIVILVLGVIFVTGDPNYHSVHLRYIKNNVKNAIKLSDKDNYKEGNKDWKYRSRGDFLKENKATFRDDEDEYIKTILLQNPGKEEFSGSGSGDGSGAGYESGSGYGSSFKEYEEPPNLDDKLLQGMGSGSHVSYEKELEFYTKKQKKESEDANEQIMFDSDLIFA